MNLQFGTSDHFQSRCNFQCPVHNSQASYVKIIHFCIKTRTLLPRLNSIVKNVVEEFKLTKCMSSIPIQHNYGNVRMQSTNISKLCTAKKHQFSRQDKTRQFNVRNACVQPYKQTHWCNHPSNHICFSNFRKMSASDDNPASPSPSPEEVDSVEFAKTDVNKANSKFSRAPVALPWRILPVPLNSMTNSERIFNCVILKVHFLEHVINTGPNFSKDQLKEMIHQLQSKNLPNRPHSKKRSMLNKKNWQTEIPLSSTKKSRSATCRRTYRGISVC